MTHLKEVNPVAPSNNKRWSKNDDQILRQMVKEKATSSQVAIVLGRTKSSIWARKNFLGLDGRLSSSKGSIITAPTTLSTRIRSANSNDIRPAKKPEKTKSVKVTNHIITNLDLETISRLAKRSGAKIVITFE
jgi:hypothetical protein